MKKLLLILFIISGCANSRKHEERLALLYSLKENHNITDSAYATFVKIENDHYNKKLNICKTK
jgi:hypothetical protein